MFPVILTSSIGHIASRAIDSAYRSVSTQDLTGMHLYSISEMAIDTSFDYGAFLIRNGRLGTGYMLKYVITDRNELDITFSYMAYPFNTAWNNLISEGNYDNGYALFPTRAYCVVSTRSTSSQNYKVGECTIIIRGDKFELESVDFNAPNAVPVSYNTGMAISLDAYKFELL